MMRFAWVLNLDAELELGEDDYTPRALLQEQLARYGGGARRLLGAGDVLLPADREGPLDGDFVGRAWCPTPRARALFSAHGVRAEPHPDVSVLRRVNHRRFAFEQGGGLEGQRYIEDRAELDVVLRESAVPLLLKRPLAFAGRGQQRMYAYSKLTEKERSWLEASLRRDGLIVEPLVTPLLELSLHGFVWRDARYELGRVCVQTVSERGVFRDVRLAEEGELEPRERDALFERGEGVAVALSTAGYFGPFGLDAYRYRQGSRQGFCALSELNARYTMGFLAGFPRHPQELVL